MARKLLAAVCGLLAAMATTLPGTASAGFIGTGTVTATPEKNSTGDEVEIDVAGNCAELLETTLVVVVTGPDGSELERRELADTSDTTFTFDQTDQTGVYTATADCDGAVAGAEPDGGATTTGATATPTAVLYSYESDTFEVFEPGVSATAVFTNDPAAPVVGVISGRPTFTG